MKTEFVKSKFGALVQEKCPRCQTGKVFKFKPLQLKKFMEMNDLCPACGLRYEIEPGFFWGAMYVSYTLTTGMMLVLGTLTYFIGNDPDFWAYIFVICGTVIFTSPFVYRYSRILMLYWFSPIRFEEKYARKN